MSRALAINENLVILAEEIEIQFVRSGGPGGQNVNKVNTKAVLRWHAAASTSLPDDVKRRFLERYAGRLTRDGDLVLSSDVHRQQGRNLTACREKLRGLIATALQVPRRRIKKRRTRGSIERRLQDKRRQSEKKGGRQFRGDGG